MTCSKIFSTKFRENLNILYKISVQANFKIRRHFNVLSIFLFPVSSGAASTQKRTKRSGNEDERNGTPLPFVLVSCPPVPRLSFGFILLKNRPETFETIDKN